MKIIVGIVIGIFAVFMSYVFVGGYIQKNNLESGMTANKQTVQPPTINTNKGLSVYTAAEVGSHNSSSNCWLIINNKVYDVTTFLGKHPGGAAAVMPYCGKEATKAFDTQDRGSSGGHSSQAADMLTSYLNGSLGAN